MGLVNGRQATRIEVELAKARLRSAASAAEPLDALAGAVRAAPLQSLVAAVALGLVAGGLTRLGRVTPLLLTALQLARRIR